MSRFRRIVLALRKLNFPPPPESGQLSQLHRFRNRPGWSSAGLRNRLDLRSAGLRERQNLRSFRYAPHSLRFWRSLRPAPLRSSRFLRPAPLQPGRFLHLFRCESCPPFLRLLEIQLPPRWPIRTRSGQSVKDPGSAWPIRSELYNLGNPDFGGFWARPPAAAENFGFSGVSKCISG